MILPKKSEIKESISNITSGFNVKVRKCKKRHFKIRKKIKFLTKNKLEFLDRKK